jgi:hypothetical protein
VSPATDFSPLSSRLDEVPSSRTRAAPVGRTVPEVRRGSRAPRPPRGFRPIRGALSNVRFGGETPKAVGRTYSQRAGIAYEQKIHDVLSAIYGAHYCINPSILFTTGTQTRRAIPDGILRIESRLVLIEVKLTHTEKAWWQLRRLYAPLLAAIAAPGTPIQCVEICRAYDPDVQFPEPHEVVTSLHALSTLVGVLQWKI